MTSHHRDNVFRWIQYTRCVILLALSANTILHPPGKSMLGQRHRRETNIGSMSSVCGELSVISGLSSLLRSSEAALILSGESGVSR